VVDHLARGFTRWKPTLGSPLKLMVGRPPSTVVLRRRCDPSPVRKRSDFWIFGSDVLLTSHLNRCQRRAHMIIDVGTAGYIAGTGGYNPCTSSPVYSNNGPKPTHQQSKGEKHVFADQGCAGSDDSIIDI